MKHVTIIPSKGRFEYLKKYDDLPFLRFKDPVFNTKLWVSTEECSQYKTMLRDFGITSIDVIADHGSTNISEARQSILQYCNANGYEYLIHPDDDIRFCDRESGYKPVSMDFESNLILYNHLLSMVSNKYPMVSVRERFMINTTKYYYELNKKILLFYVLHVPTFMKEGISFVYKDMKVYEDRIVQLLLNEKGYRTLVSAMYCHTQRHENNSVGGCSSYRTREENMRCAKIVHQDFPKVTGFAYKQGWNGAEAIFYLKRYLNKDELPYVPKEEMDKFMNRKGVYQINV